MILLLFPLYLTYLLIFLILACTFLSEIEAIFKVVNINNTPTQSIYPKMFSFPQKSFEKVQLRKQHHKIAKHHQYHIFK